MCPKNKAATMSADERHEVGCPLPAAVVEAMLWIRNWAAMPCSLSVSISFATPNAVYMRLQTVFSQVQKESRNKALFCARLSTARKQFFNHKERKGHKE